MWKSHYLLVHMNQSKVSYKRHLAKTISYRLLSTTVGILAMWWLTGSIEIGAAFGVVELIYKPIQYYIHERIWYKWVKFGLTPEKKSQKKDTIKIVSEDLVSESKKTTQPKQSGKRVLNYSSNR